MRPLVTPAARENLTVGRKGDRPGLTAAIFSNVREHITVVYASPPLDLRLSPGERGRDATLRKGGSATLEFWVRYPNERNQGNRRTL